MTSVNYLRMRQAAARELGLCLWCHAPTSGDASLCAACQAKQREAYQAARAAETCTRCGEPSGGQWACDSCRELANARRREARAGQATRTKRRRKR